LLHPELEHRETMADVVDRRLGRRGDRQSGPPDRSHTGRGQEDQEPHTASSAESPHQPSHRRLLSARAVHGRRCAGSLRPVAPESRRAERSPEGTTVTQQSELPFSRDEYRSRLDKVRRRMDASGLEVLLTTVPENMIYLTGYSTLGYFTYQLLAVSLDE